MRMKKEYETVIGLEVHVETGDEKQDFLRLLHRIGSKTKYSYLPGLYRYAGFSAGFK